jgi:hypothetical protein
MPTWEVRNMGEMLYLALMGMGVLIFIFNLKQCLIYLEPHSNSIGKEIFTDDAMNGILAKIFYYNVFEGDIEANAKVAAKRFNLDEETECDNLIKGSNCHKVKLNVNRVYNSFEKSSFVQNDINDSLMINCWIILFSSFLIMCGVSLLRVSKIYLKNTYDSYY